ncbi:MAG TPA: DOMON-like domain-containing protein [Allosphingosinicella sp.]|nr:DOMON-like domain-containing protein [Allosphingosinicella sp.]
MYSLLPHPDSTGDAVRSIQVEVDRPGPRQLTLRYLVRGTTAAIAMPRPRPPERRDGLWEETCFEAFLANAPGYLEFNFSPSTEWAAWRFDSHRSGMRAAAINPPHIETLIGVDRFEMRVALAMPVLGPMGLSAIIVAKDGSKSWWALAHPPGEPDFHHDACFALELPPAPGA